MQPTDSEAYLAKKRFFDTVLTVYGRKPVLEALQTANIKIHRLHLAKSNKSAGILTEITELAEQHGAEVIQHDRAELARISKNAKQDQGVCADIICSEFKTLNDFLKNPPQRNYTLLALDGITNPQNLGMIIRSACAGNIDGIILPKKGCAQIDPLVIKASTGTVFRAPILRTENLTKAIQLCREYNVDICGLSLQANKTLKEFTSKNSSLFVLGNETHGISKAVENLCTTQVKIPMNNGVESLNVAVTAALIAFR